MPTIQKNVDRREEWIAEARSRGKNVQAYNELTDEGWQTRFRIDDRDCNVQVREAVIDRMRLHVADNYLRECDNIVFVVRNFPQFYNIPQAEMRRLAEIATPNGWDGRAEFNINIRTDELFIRGIPHNIRLYRDNWNFR